MELMKKRIELVFIDNPTVLTSYIKELIHVAEQQDLVAQVSLKSTVKWLLIVELNRVEQVRLILSKRTKDGLSSSEKKPGRAIGKLDKMSDELREDIKRYLAQNVKEKTITIAYLLRKYKITRNTFVKYAKIISKEMG